MTITTAARLLGLSPAKIMKTHCRTIFTTKIQKSFHELDEKAGYKKISDYHEEPKTLLRKLIQGYKYLIQEMKLFKKECMDSILVGPVLVLRRGEVDVQWRFNGDPSILDKWVVTSDSDYGQGKSTATLQLTRRGRGIFSGTLDPRVYNDGIIKRAGYCNIRSVPLRKSFYRRAYLDWCAYTHLILRVRGDGRNYLLILYQPGDFDIFWNDSYHYVLHTRGGPYWQYVRIPFSKFYLTSKGRVQDIQQPPMTGSLTSVGITASDKIPGNFKLEIDYIGVEYDPIHDEEHAYEEYRSAHNFHV